MKDQLVQKLNAAAKAERLDALGELMRLYESGALEKPRPSENVNNHIHTTYSFSPYSPAMAAFMAWQNGLETAGIMDHDSIAGADEFIAAGKLIGIATTVGFECRCDMAGTPFAGKRINNPDQNSVAYLAMHGVPHGNIAKAQAFLTPYRERRNVRNRAMVANLNAVVESAGIALDFDRDVAAISRCADGGSITERHILYALAEKMIAQYGKGQATLSLLDKLGVEVAGKTRDRLMEADNPMYAYYLLGALKSAMVAQFYIPATDECPPVAEFIRLADDIGAISAYAYLGDVGDSVTGDKKTQTFEDAYLDELVAWLKQAGFRAVTYMPTRNTPQQLARVIALCDKHGLFQISGEDINSPFQSFICEALKLPQFKHLIANTWALIGHEKAATQNLSDGMFSPATMAAFPDLPARVRHFEVLGRN